MKSLRLFALLLTAACCSIGLFTACSDDDEPVVAPEPEEPVVPTDTTAVDTTATEQTYTLMMYGCGGGNLDEAMEYNLYQVAGYGYSEKVHFTALMKYSKPLQSEEGKEGTRRFTMTPDGLKNEQAFEADYRLDDPQHLADFIVQAQKDFPASHYILVLWNHGDVFSIYDQPVDDSYASSARHLVYDDVTQQTISIFEQEEAYRLAEKAGAQKLSVLYWDVCMMNMIENLYQVRNHADYIMGAAHLTPESGGYYPELMHALENSATLEEALKTYVPQAVNQWKVTMVSYPVDLSVTKTAHLEPVAAAMKECTDRICDIIRQPDTQTAYRFWGCAGGSNPKSSNYANFGNLYFFNDYETTDLVSTFVRLSNNCIDGYLSAAASKLRSAMEQAILVRAAYNMPSTLEQASIGLTWQRAASFTWKYSSFKVKSLSELYHLTAFDQVAGWSRFLEQNEYKNICWRYKLVNGSLDEELYDAADNPLWKCYFKLSDEADPSDKLMAYFIKITEEYTSIMEAQLSDADAEKYFNDFIQPYLLQSLNSKFNFFMRFYEVDQVPKFTFTFTYTNLEDASPVFTYEYTDKQLREYRISLGYEEDNVEDTEGEDPEEGADEGDNPEEGTEGEGE